MKRILSASLLLGFFLSASAAEPWKYFDDKDKSTDGRTKLVDLYKTYFPFTPPKSKEEWEKRKAFVKTQVLVANNLWPLPEKTPLNAVVHGKIDRGDYTVEKVYFASLPGHYVTGNLFRPKTEGRHPAVLAPHGHWTNARFLEETDAVAKKQIDIKAERHLPNAKQFLQAKCAQLAKMGIVVFHYDMVGSAESTAIPHREGFKDAQAELELQSFFGLQTWNSIRCLDFLETLPDVDMKKIGVTGASGGGTQTFLLGAVDDRVAAVFPAVMVSTAMQGGCVCENCSLLRVNTGNIELAGLFAPKPMAMSGADDWTKEIETKGLPELKALYKLYGAEGNVHAKAWPEFKHNYNLPARELMYAWFNKHLLGKDGPVEEQLLVPVAPKDLRVFDAEHPRPKEETDAAGVRKWMTEQSAKAPKTKEIVLPALKAMVNDELPTMAELKIHKMLPEMKLKDGTTVHRIIVGRQGTFESDAIPCMGLIPAGFEGTALVWAHPKGKASLFDGDLPTKEAKEILDRKIAILAFDAFQCGELAGPEYKVDKTYAGFTYGYNRSVLANRAHDILTVLGLAKNIIKPKKVLLAAWEEMGPAAAIALPLSGDYVAKAAVDLHKFRFEDVKATNDPMLLPGALKYGGMGSFLALRAPHPLFTHNQSGTGTGNATRDAYKGAEDKLQRKADKATVAEVVEWLAK